MCLTYAIRVFGILHWEVILIILELSQYVDPITQDVTFSIEESLRLLCNGSLGRAKRFTPLLLARAPHLRFVHHFQVNSNCRPAHWAAAILPIDA
jgi:hypothetical protein